MKALNKIAAGFDVDRVPNNAGKLKVEDLIAAVRRARREREREGERERERENREETREREERENKHGLGTKIGLKF